MSDVDARLRKCFAAVFPDIPTDRILALTQENCDAWDSLATATLICLLEEEFAVTIDFEELETMTSFGSVANMLNKRAAG